MSAFWYTVAGIAVGGIITYLVSRYYYVRAARSLERATAKLEQQTNLIQRGLEEGLGVEYIRDEQGRVISIKIKLQAHIGASSHVSSSGTVRHQDDASPADQE